MCGCGGCIKVQQALQHSLCQYSLQLNTACQQNGTGAPSIKYFPSRCNLNKQQLTAMPGSGAQVLAGSTATILASAAVRVNGACLALLLLWRQAQELKHTLVPHVILHGLCPLAQRKHLFSG